MATFSTHILSSLDGTHLSNVEVSLIEISKGGKRKTIFKKKTDLGGRVKTHFSPKIGEKFEHQVVISMPESLDIISEKDKSGKNTTVSSISVGIKFENLDATYHMPFILSPYGFSSWISR